MKLALFSPAKVNLFFRILNKRADGYHEIASLYQSISLGDRLEVELAGADSLECTDPTLPCDSSNLILRATDLFRKKTGRKIFAKFFLAKQIPIEAGLGGGSSNAATTLWALNELAGRVASEEELTLWAADLGSDVPFFFSSGTAYCTGRGENLKSLAPLNEVEKYWIIKPDGGLSTPLVYKNTDLSLIPNRDPEKSLEAFLQGNPDYFNDLEYASFKLEPSLAQLKSQLVESGFHTALMTGSGTAFFCKGSKTPPNIPGARFFSVGFVNKKREKWYEFPEFC